MDMAFNTLKTSLPLPSPSHSLSSTLFIMPRPPTIRDIAAATGLHYSTVSLALRRDPRIKTETVKRVQDMAGQLGYVADPLFTSLMSRIRAGRHERHRETLAYVTYPGNTCPQGWRKNHAYRGFYDGAVAKAESLGCKLEVFESAQIIGHRLNSILRARGIRGVVFTTVFDTPKSGEISWDGLAGVQIEPHVLLPMLPTVSNDQTQTVRDAYLRVRELGYRRVGLAIEASWDAYIGHTWLAGYLTAAHGVHGVPERERLKPFISREWNAEAFAKWFRTEKPDVILTLDRTFVWRWLAELGLRVPRDVAYVELDLPPDETAAEVAGMRQSHEAVGEAAVSLVVSRLYHNETGPDKNRMITRIEGTWCDGATAPGKR